MPESKPFTLPQLPWGESALSPVISKNTIDFHYGKHHAAYVNNLNGLVAGTDMADMSLEELARSTRGVPDKSGVFNNGAQVWNHTFFWESLSPEQTSPSQELLSKVNDAFGSMAEFQAKFAKAAAGQFGSGWAWLTAQNGTLAIETTANADTPMAQGRTCLLTVDVWEHAYYLDYQNRRPDYLKAVIEKLLNWRAASDRFAAA